MSIGFGGRRFSPDGREHREIFLVGPSLSCFFERAEAGEVKAHLAGLLNVDPEDIVEVKLGKSHDPKSAPMEVVLNNPGKCIEEFLEDHWGHQHVGVDFNPLNSRFNMVCVTCQAALRIPVENFKPWLKERLEGKGEDSS